jgi:hypothetical protein
MIVTADRERHIFVPSPAAMTTLLALAKADAILVWDRRPGASLLLVSVWSTNRPPAGVAEPIAALVLTQHVNRQLIWGGGLAP